MKINRLIMKLLEEKIVTNKLYNPLSITTVKATTDINQQRFIGFDGSYCTAGAKALGVCDVDTEKGQKAPVATIGTLLVECGGTIAIGDSVASDSDGKAVKLTASAISNGYSRDEGELGDLIRIERGI